MTAALPTRPRYAREFVTFTAAEIDALVEAGKAQLFVTTKGPIYVVKSENGSFKVTTDQIVYSAPVEDDNAAEASLADQDYYEAKADALGISVGELTDGEYADSRPRKRAFDADLLAQFS